jgi:hypothetical protein
MSTTAKFAFLGICVLAGLIWEFLLKPWLEANRAKAPPSDLEINKARRDAERREEHRSEQGASGDRFANARAGKPPHPHARFVDFPGGGMRIIDLRSIPMDELRIARLGLVQEQLLLERPVPVPIWVAPIEAVREWAAMSETALIVLQDRFRDPRQATAKNYLYPYGGKLTVDESKRLLIANLEVVEEFTNLSDPPRSLEDFLDPPEPWTASVDDRPVPPCDVFSADPSDGKPIWLIEGVAFIDLRRQHPDTWQNGTAIARLQKVWLAFARDASVKYAVWVVAPWVLERLDDTALADLEKLIRMIPSRISQRLAVLVTAGERISNEATMDRLGAKLSPLTERLLMRTPDRGVFDVAPIDALHDAYFVEARTKPRL